MLSFAQDSPSQTSKPLTLRAVWDTIAHPQTSLIRTCAATRSAGNSQATRKPKVVAGSFEKNNVQVSAPYAGRGEEQMEAG